MPYKSDKQRRLMQAVAHNPKFAKKVGIPQSVGRKFELHKAEGGEVRREPGKVPRRYRKDTNALGTISKVARHLSRSEENKSANQRVFAGLMKQLYGLNKNREPAFLGGLDMDPNPGIVDEILALPNLLPDRFVPEVSKQAQRDLEELSAKVNRDMGLREAHGFRERGQEALGTMLGQIPIAAARTPGIVASKAKPLSKRFIDAMATAGEWFTPTVEATPLNYAIGTAVGGGLGGAADMFEDMADAKEAEKLKKAQKALPKAQGGAVHFGKGGRVEALVEAVRQLKRLLAENDDVPHTEVYKTISKISDDHEVPVSRVVEILEGTPIPERRVNLQAVSPQPHPERRTADLLVRAAKLREQLEAPHEWLNAPVPTLDFQGRQDLTTAYAHALNAHEDLVAKPTPEALKLYEDLTNKFTQMAEPHKPQKAMGGAVHKCSCQE